MTDFARWIASTSPVIYVGHCDDVQCFYCDGGEYQHEPDDVLQQEPGRFGERCWHRPDCLWLLALAAVLPTDQRSLRS